MKKIRHFIPLLFGTLSASFLSCCSASFSVEHSSKNDDAIPDEYFNITSNGVLKGFVSGITPASLWGYKKLVIPANVVEIENNAFANMFDKHSSLRHLVLNQNLKKIGACAFINCYAFGNGATEAETGDIDFSAATNVEIIGNEAFSGIQFGNEYLNLSLMSKLTSIGIGAFKYAEFKKLKFPNSLVEVGSRAFCDCTEITSIDMTAYDSIPTWLFNNKNIFWNINTKGSDKTIQVKALNNSIDEWQDVFERQKIVTTGEMINFKVVAVRMTDSDSFTYNDDHYITGLSSNFSSNDCDILHFPAKHGTNTINGINWNYQDVYAKMNGKQMRIEFDPECQYTFFDNSFKGFSNLIGDLVLPQLTNAQSIGVSAFEGCSNLSSIDFSQTGFDIGASEIHFKKQCFYNCSNAAKIIFPDLNGKSVKFFADAFSNCNNLSLIDLSACTGNFTMFLDKTQEIPFNNISKFGLVQWKLTDNTSELIQQFKNINFSNISRDINSDWYISHKDSEKQTFSLKHYATTGNYALHGIKQAYISSISALTDILIPESILYIKNDAFNNILFAKNGENWCNWYLELNNGLQEIDDSAFANCNHLVSSLNLPHTLKYLGDKAFFRCNQLRGCIHIPDSITNIGTQCFAGCSRLYSTNLVLPAKLTSIGGFAFADTAISSITIPKLDHDLTLQANSFLGMNELESIYLTNFESNDIAHLKGNNKSLLLSKTSGKIYVKSGTKSDWKTHLESLGLAIVESGSGWQIVEQ